MEESETFVWPCFFPELGGLSGHHPRGRVRVGVQRMHVLGDVVLNER